MEASNAVMEAISNHLAPYYLSTNRGYYCGSSLHRRFNHPEKLESLLFTGNIRFATPFSSYQDAERLFNLLKIVAYLEIKYCAILVSPKQVVTEVASTTPNIPNIPNILERNYNK